MSPLDELATILRPAGGGVHLVSTGRAEQLALQRRLYGAATDADVDGRFRDAIARIPSARAVLLGVPSDVGAGFRRGANLGPQAMRAALLDEQPDFPEEASREGLVDIGDVFVVPQLLHDDMLSAEQREASQRAIYPSIDGATRARLPVSPLSIAERALDLVLAMNPRIRPIVLGGDHSTAWPVVSALSRAQSEPWGIVQSDAHTDLLSERLGIKYCFATWSYHANDLLGRGGRLVQVGVRASRYERAHWEGGLDVRQFWADECLAKPDETIDAVVAHLKAIGVRRVYFSNDIDGTDARHAPSTGTPETGGLEPAWLLALLRRLSAEVELLGGDVMEVAPPLGPTPEDTARTVSLAVSYLRETIAAVLRPRRAA
jgi:arginase family enzyme